MSWWPILLTFSVVLLVAANISLLVSNHRMMKANESLLTSLSEYEDLHQTLMSQRDKWRTKARLLQGKYEPIGTVMEKVSDDPVDRWWEMKLE